MTGHVSEFVHVQIIQKSWRGDSFSTIEDFQLKLNCYCIVSQYKWDNCYSCKKGSRRPEIVENALADEIMEISPSDNELLSDISINLRIKQLSLHLATVSTGLCSMKAGFSPRLKTKRNLAEREKNFVLGLVKNT